MSDERPESESEPDHEPEAHGVVETLREEIVEVVEHVPEPVRWTVGKLVRLASLVLAGVLVLAIVSTVLYFMNRTELVARELSLFLNRTLREHSDLVLDMRDIRGNPFTGFRAIQPRVRFRDGNTVLAANEMRVNYTAWSLLTRGKGTVEITLDHPTVRLTGDHGEWRLPVWRSGLPRNAKPTAARVLQVRLHIRDAAVTTPRPYGETVGVNADVIANTGSMARVRLERLDWKRGPWDSKLERMTADLSVDPSGVHLQVGDLRTADLELRAEGGWPQGSTHRHVHMAVGRVRWKWLAKVFDNRSFDVPGDGGFVLDAEGDKDWRGRFRTSLEWDGLPVEGTGVAAWQHQQLVLDSLDAHSLAGDLKGALRWSRAGWEIFGDAKAANPAYWHMLHLDGWPSGNLNGWFRYRLETRGRPIGVLEARLAASEWQGWRADDALVRVDFPPVAADSFSVQGARRGGRFTLRGRTDRGGGWSGPYTIRDLPLDEWPDGRATGLTGMLTRADGSVESRAGELFVTGELAGTGTHWSAARFAGWTLSGVHGRLLPTPELSAKAGARDGFFSGIHLDSLAAPVALGNQVVRFMPLTAQAGDTTLTMTGQAAWEGASWWMTLTGAEAASGQFHFSAEPPVRLTGDPGGVVFERLLADDRDAHVEARGRWAAPGGPYDFEFTGQRLDLARIGMPLDWGLGGRADMRLTVQGRSGDPRWRFEGHARAPTMSGHGADSLSIALAGGAHRLELEDGRFDLGGGSLRAAGAVERAPAEFPDSLSATALVRWLRDAGSWRGRITAAALPIAPFASQSPSGVGWDGRVSGTVSLAGSPARPVLDADLRADRFGWHDIRADRVDVRAHYANGRLDAQDVRANMQNVQSSARLSVPLRLALGVTPVVPDESVTGRIDIPAGDLQVLPLLVPQLQSARGKFDLTAEISGTARSPKLAGRSHIRDGLVRAVNRGEIIEGVSADLHFDQSRIVLDTLSARQGRTGRMWSHGAVLLDGGHLRSYRFNVGMRDFAAAEEGMYAMLFDGDFVVSDGPLVGGERLPQVTGQANIKKGVIEFDFANQTEVQRRAATTQPLYWTYRIKAEAKNNLRWRPQDADIEFDADLDLQQTPDSLLIYGEMHALRGTYWFLSNRFKILNADITFDNQQGVDPLLDIAAETRLQLQSSSKSSGASLGTVTAQLTGRSSQPVISLTSTDPSADQRTILAGLTLGGLRQDPSRPFVGSDPLDNYFTRQLNAQLSASLSEFFKGAITDWEVQRDQGGLISGQGSYVVGVGSQVTDRLALRYRQRIQGPGKTLDSGVIPDINDLFDQNVEAEYRINRFIFVTSGVSRRRSPLGTVQQPNTDYNLNLKARWEY